MPPIVFKMVGYFLSQGCQRERESLLQAYDLPPFSSIRPEHVKPAIERILADNRAAIARLLETQREQPTWKGLVLAMDELNDRLGAAWSPVSHLNAVCNSAELREAYEACLPELSAYSTELGQNRALFEAYEALAKSPEAAGFDVAQKTILEHALRDFRLSGIDLPADKQKRYAEVQSRLSELGSRFSNQLLDATQAWTKHVTDEAALAGLTDSAKAQMKQAAEAKGLDGWLISLEFPSYYAVMTYADDRALRERVYAAYCTRASDQGPNAGQNDNGPVMEEILDLRQELAGLLGFANYAELSLATKMAESSDQVLSFLRDLAVRSKPFAARDLEQLRAYAAEQGCTELQSWDAGYYAEKLREALQRVPGGAACLLPGGQGAFRPVRHRRAPLRHPDPRTARFRTLARRRTPVRDPRERRTRRPLLLRPLCPRQQARRCLDGRRPRPPARRPGPADRPGGLPGVQLHPGGERQAGAADPRRGHYPVPRVRPWPAPPADPRRACRRLRDQRGGLGRRRAAQPVHGELVLGTGRPGADLRPLRDRRGAAAGPAGEDAGGEELPVRDDDGPPAGVLPLRLRAARHPRRRPACCRCSRASATKWR